MVMWQWNEVRVPGAQMSDGGFQMVSYNTIQLQQDFSESLSSLPGTECFEIALINNRGSSPYIILHLECHNTFHLSVAGKINTIIHIELKYIIHKILS